MVEGIPEIDHSPETDDLLRRGKIYYLGSVAITKPEEASNLFKTDWGGDYDSKCVEGKDFLIGEILRLNTTYERNGEFESVAHRVAVYDASSLVENELRRTFNKEGLEEKILTAKGALAKEGEDEIEIKEATKSLSLTLGQLRVAMYGDLKQDEKSDVEKLKDEDKEESEGVRTITKARDVITEAEGILDQVGVRLEEKLKELEETKKRPPIIVIPNFNEGPALGPDFGLLATGRKVITLSYPREKHANFSNSSVLEWTSVEDYMPFFKTVFKQVKDLGYIDREYYALSSSGGSSMHLGLVNDANFRQEFEPKGLVLHNPGSVMERSMTRVVANFFKQGWQGYAKEGHLETKVRMDDPIYPSLAEGEHVDPLLYFRDFRFLLNSAKMVGKKIPLPTDVPILILASEKDSIFPPSKLREVLSEEGCLKTSKNPNGNVQIREALRRSHIGLSADELVAQPALKWFREVESEQY